MVGDDMSGFFEGKIDVVILVLVYPEWSSM